MKTREYDCHSKMMVVSNNIAFSRIAFQIYTYKCDDPNGIPYITRRTIQTLQFYRRRYMFYRSMVCLKCCCFFYFLRCEPDQFNTTCMQSHKFRDPAGHLFAWTARWLRRILRKLFGGDQGNA